MVVAVDSKTGQAVGRPVLVAGGRDAAIAYAAALNAVASRVGRAIRYVLTEA